MTMEAQLIDALRYVSTSLMPMLRFISSHEYFSEIPGTGVLGRMLDILEGSDHSVAAFGINDDAPILEGGVDFGRQVDVVKGNGADWFYDRGLSTNADPDYMDTYFSLLNQETVENSGLFGDLYSQRFVNSVNKTEFLRDLTRTLELNETYKGQLSSLKMVSKLILSQEERQTNRDTFFVRMGGYDTHANVKDSLDKYKFPDLNSAIESFYREMDNAGYLDSITFVIGSEFGRVSRKSYPSSKIQRPH